MAADNSSVVDLEKGSGVTAETASPTPSDLTLTFRVKSASTSSKTKKKSKQILTDVEGFVRAGEMCALMGPSGSGKTTLLDTLAMRSTLNNDSELYLNNKRLNLAELRKLSEYVEQEDKLIGCITVRETFKFAAELALPKSIPAHERVQRVNDMVRLLGLQNQANTIIGTPVQKGCSGGQKRRVTVGAQLITQPRILFLDEVTSGLDSVASYEAMKAIRNIAKANNMMIICSIHQPSTSTFNLFDSVLLLSRGQQVYFGPILHLEDYFSAVGRPVPEYYNPAEHCLEITNTDFLGNDADQDLALLWQKWKESKELEETKTIIDQARLMSAARVSEVDLATMNLTSGSSGSVSRPGMLSHIKTLTHRGFLKSYRDLLPYWMRVAMYLGLAFLMATVWVRLKVDQNDIQAYMNSLFFAVAFLSFMALAYIPAFLEDRAAYVKERNGGLYGPGAFMISNIIVGAPYLFLISLLFSLVTYWLINFNPKASAFFRYVMWYFLDLLAAESLVVLSSAVWPNFIGGLIVASCSNALWMCASGFMVAPNVLNAFYKNTFLWINYQRFAFYGLLFNEFETRTYSCGSDCQCSVPSPLNTECKIAGADVIRSRGFGGEHIGLWVGLILVVTIVMRFLAYLLLKYKK